MEKQDGGNSKPWEIAGIVFLLATLVMMPMAYQQIRYYYSDASPYGNEECEEIESSIGLFQQCVENRNSMHLSIWTTLISIGLTIMCFGQVPRIKEMYWKPRR